MNKLVRLCRRLRHCNKNQTSPGLIRLPRGLGHQLSICLPRRSRARARRAAHTQTWGERNESFWRRLTEQMCSSSGTMGTRVTASTTGTTTTRATRSQSTLHLLLPTLFTSLHMPDPVWDNSRHSSIFPFFWFATFIFYTLFIHYNFTIVLFSNDCTTLLAMAESSCSVETF